MIHVRNINVLSRVAHLRRRNCREDVPIVLQACNGQITCGGPVGDSEFGTACPGVFQYVQTIFEFRSNHELT